MYDVFHTTWASRLGHIFGTGCIHTAVGAVVLWGLLPWSGVVAGSALGAYLALQLAYALRMDRMVALAMVLPLSLITAGAVVVVAVTGPWTPVAAVILALVGMLVQAGSHGFEPVPPPWSGSNRFVPFSELLRERGLRSIPGFIVLFLLGNVLELWATMRILALQVLFVMLELGYRPELREATLKRRQEILDDPGRGWGGGAVGVRRADPVGESGGLATNGPS